MWSEVLLAATFQVLPFYEQKPADDYYALRPFWSRAGETTDVLWPVFTSHRDWWRFCFFTHYQSYEKGGYQFEIMPIWWNGRAEESDDAYCGLFPLWGYHPHILLLHDWKFALWPLWMQYKMPRPSEKRMLTTNAVLWPLFHWREDGSWGFWPLYVRNHQRESLHQTVLWPLVTWASYEEDRDTAGAGYSWMFWPFAARINRNRESQWMFLPPFFSHVETASGWRGRYPWPLVEIERTTRRDRLSFFPFYEQVDLKGYAAGEDCGWARRFLWKFVELTDDETRVFPFWVSRPDGTYFRLWPFYESTRGAEGVTYGRFLSLFPIRHVPAVDRNWAKFWTFYERAETKEATEHSLLWGIFRWRTNHD